MIENTSPTHKRSYEWLKPFQFKKGEVHNPTGKTGEKLKTFVSRKLATMDEKEKVAFLKSIDPELVWRMGEGNPKQDTDITSGGKPIPIYGGQSVQVPEHDGNKEDIPTDQENQSG